MDTSGVPVPGESALVSPLQVFACIIFSRLFQQYFISFASAFALKGVEYDQVPVNLIKDGGQQVQ